MMPTIDPEAERLLRFLVQKLPAVDPQDPRTFIGYKDVHDALGLTKIRETYGESLKPQGLDSLADWTKIHNLPLITGLVIDRSTMMPGKGYFKLLGPETENFNLWLDHIKRSKVHDWSPYLGASVPPVLRSDDPLSIEPEPVDRKRIEINGLMRDTALATRVKELHDFACQICNVSIVLPDNRKYAEAHHIRPLGEPHNVPDVLENIMCVCPNHHVELDYASRSISIKALRFAKGHNVGEEYVQFHNQRCGREPG